MQPTIVRAVRIMSLLGFGLTGVVLSTGCRPMMFWRDPLIHGQTQVMGQPAAGTEGTPITLNFIHHQGSLEDTLVSVEADAAGRYRSPNLVPGAYTVEAMLPGYVIAESVVEVRSHEYKRVDLKLYRIGEAEGRTMAESGDDNIHTPGQVQIGRPK